MGKTISRGDYFAVRETLAVEGALKIKDAGGQSKERLQRRLTARDLRSRLAETGIFWATIFDRDPITHCVVANKPQKRIFGTRWADIWLN